MRRLFSYSLMIAMAAVFLTLPTTASAQQAIQLDVDESAICENVVNLEPVDAGSNFPFSVGRLYCFTRIIGAHIPTTVTHVWYYGMTERARVELVIKGSRWRTYSSKIIQPHEVGDWRVEILDTEGTVLKVVQFKITSEQEVTQPPAAMQDEETDLSNTKEAPLEEPNMPPEGLEQAEDPEE